MTIEGRPYVATPPSADEVARQRAEAEAFRRAQQEAAEQSAPVRRRLLEAGPPLRDVDAAMACHDSCHPTVDVTDRHQGGTTCMCQQTEAERAESRRRALEGLDRLRGLFTQDRSREGLDEAVAALDVQVHEIGGMAPFQITAAVDGRSFYLRARHEAFALWLAPEDAPNLFTTEHARWGVGELEIASGDEDDLGPRWADALNFSVQRVRDYLRQQRCDHRLAEQLGGEARFCPWCGSRLTTARDA